MQTDLTLASCIFNAELSPLETCMYSNLYDHGREMQGIMVVIPIGCMERLIILW